MSSIADRSVTTNAANDDVGQRSEADKRALAQVERWMATIREFTGKPDRPGSPPA